MKSNLYIMIGLPGSGKDTLAKVMKKQNEKNDVYRNSYFIK